MGSVAHPPEVILFDYQFAPNAQKARNLLNACGIPYKSCEQPFVQPRTALLDLGITYRRIPVNFIGKDGYCDNRAFTDAVQTIFKDKALPTHSTDHAFESFGYRTFWICLPLVPAELLSPDMQKDRADLFAVFTRPDFADLKPSALAEYKQVLDMVENDFLADGGPWIHGDRCSIADIHASWMIKWAVQTLDVGSEPGFSRDDFPKFYAWIEGLPKHDAKGEAEKIEAKDAAGRILSADYAAPEVGVDERDPTGLKAGEKVAVATNDEYVFFFFLSISNPRMLFH